jgi:IS5 family transposase
MLPKRTNHRQGRLFEQRLSELLNPHNELALLASYIKWSALEKEFAPFFDKEDGKPAKPVRLITGIMILQHMYKLSDEAVIARWVENPYWQLFCGYDYLQWEFPLHPTTLTKWRQRLGEDGLSKVLCIVIETARSMGAITASSCKKVIVDTTVAPKAIAYPTDAKSYLSSLKELVGFAKAENIHLRQTYERLAPKAYRRANRLFHARKHKMAHKEIQKLKRYCCRVFREVLRASVENPELEKRIKPVFFVIGQILMQEEEGMEKIYSLHEPEVECIAKGKVHKKYEFGCKASFVVTHKEGFILGSKALHGNPFDGHTLKEAIEQAEGLSGTRIDKVFVDKGYRGHGVTTCQVISSYSKRKLNWRQMKDLKRRQAIEPHIGHMKSDGKLGRNHLAGVLGDKLHVLLCGIGHNIRLLCNFLKAEAYLSTA